MSAPVDADVTAEMVRHKFHFDEALGRLRHRLPSRRAYVGRIASISARLGYRQVRLNKRLYSESRLIWLWVYGVLPKNEIDHINGIRDDNRIQNMRDATRAENVRNQGSRGPNLKGTSRRKNRWIAQIGANYKRIHLGVFDTEREAHAAYCEAARALYGDFAKVSPW